MESTKEKRVFHKGPPPHVGWWNASSMRSPRAWRWWNGKVWSRPSFADFPTEKVARRACEATPYPGNVEWSDYWPENARVPRVDPRSAT